MSLKVRLKVLVSVTFALGFVAFLVFMPQIQIHKHFETKLYRFTIIHELEKDLNSFVKKINDWADEKNVMCDDIKNLWSFVDEPQNKQSEYFASGRLAYVCKNYPKHLDGLLGLAILDLENRNVEDAYFEDFSLYKKFESLIATKRSALFNNANKETPTYFKDEEFLVFYSDVSLKNKTVVVFVRTDVFFNDSENYIPLTIHNGTIENGSVVLGFVKAKLLKTNYKNNLENFINEAWKSSATNITVSSFNETFYLLSKKTIFGQVSILADANFFVIPVGKKVLLIFLLVISFSFLIFLLLNLIPNEKYFTEMEIEEMTLSIFKECFIDKNNFKNYDIIMKETKYKRYITQMLKNIFGNKFLKKNQTQIEDKIESIWKNIFEFNMQLKNSEASSHTENNYLNNYSALKETNDELEILELEPFDADIDDSEYNEDPDMKNTNNINAMKIKSFNNNNIVCNSETVCSCFEKASALNASSVLENSENKKQNTERKSFLKKAKYLLHNLNVKAENYSEPEFLTHYDEYVPQMFSSKQNLSSSLLAKVSLLYSDKAEINENIKKENIKSTSSIMETDDGLFEIVNTYAKIEKNSQFENLVAKILHTN